MHNLLQSYQLIKPLIPRRLQIAVRRWVALRKHLRFENVWPIKAGTSPPTDKTVSWPDGKSFALVLTHDVESKQGRERCGRLASIESALGFRSSFNFVAEGYEVPAALRKGLAERGFEIGIHGIKHNVNPFRSERSFHRQAVKINQYLREWDAVGFRCPCMYHRLDLIAQLNIDYDSSTFDIDPFEPQSDGVDTIFPFRVSDHSRRGYVELPYTLPQDFTIFILLAQRGIDLWKRKLDWIVQRGGMALINTHPDYMNFGDSPLRPDEYPVTFYLDFLHYVAGRYKDRFWHVLPRQMATFWTRYVSQNPNESRQPEHHLALKCLRTSES